VVCVNCSREADLTRDLKVSVEVLGSDVDAKKDHLGHEIFTTKTTHRVQNFRFGFCNQCMRVKVLFSHNFFWFVLCLLMAILVTFGIYSGLWRNQLAPVVGVLLLFWSGAIVFGYIFVRKVWTPDRNTNEDIVNWFVSQIVKYCAATYGENAGSVFYK
jgi:hypothetical protein